MTISQGETIQCITFFEFWIIGTENYAISIQYYSEIL